jgi:hypothetical protein
MDRIARRVSMLACAAALLSPLPAAAFSSGPPDGFCGDPPAMMTCALCHNDYDLNSGDGLLELLGLPAAFTPGADYDLTVRLRDPGQQRWGFMMTTLGAGNTQAGGFALLDAVRTQVSDNPGTDPDYIKQTTAGTDFPSPNGPVSWTFRWTAPMSGAATFYLAGNAADGTEDPGLDYIYTLVRTVEQQTVAATTATWSAVKSLYKRN